MPGKLLTVIWIFVLPWVSFGQEIQVKGGFMQDSIGLGQPIQYWLTVSYPPQLQVVLPDSNFNFQPFELVSKSYTPTQIRKPQYFDSAVYSLTSFEIDSVQFLNLPAIFISQQDSNLINAPTDSIYTIHQVVMASDTLSLKENTEFREVASNVNYPLIWILTGLLVVLGFFTYLFFGARIKKYFILRQLHRDYSTFSDKISQAIKDLKTGQDKQKAANALSIWKVFMERLEKKPYTSLTSKEILSLSEAKELKDVLRNIDRSIYGGVTNETLFKDFQSIEDFTQHRYGIVVESIKNN